MGIEGTLGKARRTPTEAHAPELPVILCIAAIVLISLYSAFAINRLVVANAPPTVSFTLGTSYRDVTYCNSQTLDVYIPGSAPVRPLPLAIFVHGGGLTKGSKEWLKPEFLNALASSGFAVASLNYRLAPRATFPAQIEDVKCGIRYLRAHAQTYGFDTNRVFAFGTSYGGTMVALAALTGSHSSFDTGPYPDQSSSIGAAVDLFGPADLPRFVDTASLNLRFGGKAANLTLGSPTHYVKANVPPILLIHGMADTEVPESQSVELYQRLSAAGDQTQLILVHNMGHMFAQVGSQPIDPSLTQMAQDTVNWFQRYMPRS